MESPSHVRIEEALADVARVGPFFSVDTDPGVAGDPLWRPFTELHGPALVDQIASVRVRLGTDEARVAASILFQGVAGRLLSPLLATSVVYGVVPDLEPSRTYWRAASPGPVRLAAPGAGVLRADAGTLHRVAIDRHLRPLAVAVQEATPIAGGLLWGNAASALAGAYEVLARALPGVSGAVGEAVGTGGRRLVEELFSLSPLRGTGALGPRGLRRRSCCLYYRVPGGGLCGDCALR